MKRKAEKLLENWYFRPKTRKPLIIRGARQVGKSTLVRQFAQEQGIDLIELNLERHPHNYFASHDPKFILSQIELTLGKRIPNTTNRLLFIDEIQQSADALIALRYFYEEMPDLPVIAAGSLLEFLFHQEEVSVPVGRVEYLYLGPMTFEEFLLALDEELLIEEITMRSNHISSLAHQKLISRLKEFIFVGGMPEAVKTFVEEKSLFEALTLHQKILQTYADDFPKYNRRHSGLTRIEKIWKKIPTIIGKKVKYSALSEDPSKNVREAIDLLIQARVIFPVIHSNCTSSPLHFTADDSVYKLYFMDVGLLTTLTGHHWANFSNFDELMAKGFLAEQFVAQHLYLGSGKTVSPELHYWLKDKKVSKAEVDFILETPKAGDVQQFVPVEVKSGTVGRMKSLHQMMLSLKLKEAIRLDLGSRDQYLIKTKVMNEKSQLQTVTYTLQSYPLYLIEHLLNIK